MADDSKTKNAAMDKKALYDEIWYWYLTGEWRVPPPPTYLRNLKLGKTLLGWLPSNPHCIECSVPMAGIGANLLRWYGSAPSSFSSKICSACEKSARKNESGAEVELTMLFADVRGSTPLAESISAQEFRSLIQRFYKETSHVLVHLNSMVNRLMGDQVSALFVPRFAGKNHGLQGTRSPIEECHLRVYPGRAGARKRELGDREWPSRQIGVAVNVPGVQVTVQPIGGVSAMRAHAGSKPSAASVRIGAGPPRPASPCSANCGDDSSTPHSRRAAAVVSPAAGDASG